MAVLEHDPQPVLTGLVYHAQRDGPLTLAQRQRVELVATHALPTEQGFGGQHNSLIVDERKQRNIQTNDLVSPLCLFVWFLNVFVNY